MKFDHPKQLVDFTLQWNDIKITDREKEVLYRMANILFEAGIEKGKEIKNEIK